ncbi:MAG TPA: alternative ribosome rescue aminoacyl-tRNA hydrolase ArfB [bacterium]|nr:alternative ribosome rescue aminoacyl-tRNA hydrolase ArfB [bacterium]HPN42719.1 alternative ribosome rescue aminoacyl-tRNA hydrolase ArfB [bacterium]
MISINFNTFIDESELEFSASRSSGPGGQNVNKVSSKITLSFDVRKSAGLTEEQKALIMQRLASRINKEGILQLSVQDSRSQFTNKNVAILRFTELLAGALQTRKKRRPTRPSMAAKVKRLEAKKQRSEVKSTRGKVEY